MKLTLNEAMVMVQSLPKIMDKEVPAKTAYWMSRATDQLQSELRPFEKARFKLIEKYATKDDSGELVKTGDQYEILDMPGFEKEFAELAGQEIEIKYEPIPVDHLGDIKLTPRDLLGLGRLLRDGGEYVDGEGNTT